MSYESAAKVGDFVVLTNGRVGRFVRFDGEVATVVSGLEVYHGVDAKTLRPAFSSANSHENEVE